MPPMNPPYVCTEGLRGFIPWVTWEVVTGVQGSPVESYYNTCWITGHWSTQAKAEGIVLKASWLWGGDTSVITIPLEDQAAPDCM